MLGGVGVVLVCLYILWLYWIVVFIGMSFFVVVFGVVWVYVFVIL